MSLGTFLKHESTTTVKLSVFEAYQRRRRLRRALAKALADYVGYFKATIATLEHDRLAEMTQSRYQTALRVAETMDLHVDHADSVALLDQTLTLAQLLMVKLDWYFYQVAPDDYEGHQEMTNALSVSRTGKSHYQYVDCKTMESVQVDFSSLTRGSISVDFILSRNQAYTVRVEFHHDGEFPVIAEQYALPEYVTRVSISDISARMGK